MTSKSSSDGNAGPLCAQSAKFAFPNKLMKTGPRCTTPETSPAKFQSTFRPFSEFNLYSASAFINRYNIFTRFNPSGKPALTNGALFSPGNIRRLDFHYLSKPYYQNRHGRTRTVQYGHLFTGIVQVAAIQNASPANRF